MQYALRVLAKTGRVAAVAALALVTAPSAAVTPALAGRPLRLDSQVTDQVNALGSRRAEVDAALGRLRGETSLQLFIVYVRSFSGTPARQWADETATRSDLGTGDGLLAFWLWRRARRRGPVHLASGGGPSPGRGPPHPAAEDQPTTEDQPASQRRHLPGQSRRSPRATGQPRPSRCAAPRRRSARQRRSLTRWRRSPPISTRHSAASTLSSRRWTPTSPPAAPPWTRAAPQEPSGRASPQLSTRPGRSPSRCARSWPERSQTKRPERSRTRRPERGRTRSTCCAASARRTTASTGRSPGFATLPSAPAAPARCSTTRCWPPGRRSPRPPTSSRPGAAPSAARPAPASPRHSATWTRRSPSPVRTSRGARRGAAGRCPR